MTLGIANFEHVHSFSVPTRIFAIKTKNIKKSGFFTSTIANETMRETIVSGQVFKKFQRKLSAIKLIKLIDDPKGNNKITSEWSSEPGPRFFFWRQSSQGFQFTIFMNEFFEDRRSWALNSKIKRWKFCNFRNDISHSTARHQWFIWIFACPLCLNKKKVFFDSTTFCPLVQINSLEMNGIRSILLSHLILFPFLATFVLVLSDSSDHRSQNFEWLFACSALLPTFCKYVRRLRELT